MGLFSQICCLLCFSTHSGDQSVWQPWPRDLGPSLQHVGTPMESIPAAQVSGSGVKCLFWVQLVNPNKGFHSIWQPNGAATLLLMAWQKGMFMGNQQTPQPWSSDGYCGSSWVRQGASIIGYSCSGCGWARPKVGGSKWSLCSQLLAAYSSFGVALVVWEL